MENELESRLRHFGAFKLNNTYFCAVHPGVELNEDGSCDECIHTDAIMGSEIREAEAMDKAQRILEHDV